VVAQERRDALASWLHLDQPAARCMDHHSCSMHKLINFNTFHRMPLVPTCKPCKHHRDKAACLWLPSSVTRGVYKSGRLSRKMPHLQPQKQVGHVMANRSLTLLMRGTQRYEAAAEQGTHPARLTLHASRSNVWVTKPSTAGGLGCMLPCSSSFGLTPTCRQGNRKHV
jgi:hypothetical protein